MDRDNWPLFEKKDSRRTQHSGIDIGGEDGDEDERHPVRGLRRKIGGSYDYGGAAANIKNTIHLESLLTIIPAQDIRPSPFLSP